MVDHKSVGRCVSVLAVGFVIGACSFAMPATALGAAQDGPAVAYSTNDMGMQFASVPAGQFPMGCFFLWKKSPFKMCRRSLRN